MIILRKNKESLGRKKEQDHMLNRIRQLMQLNKYNEALPLLREQFELHFNCKNSEVHTDPRVAQIYSFYAECLIHNNKLGEGLAILAKGLQKTETERLCRESLGEKAIPFMEKYMIHHDYMEEAYDQLKIIEMNCPIEITKKAVEAFLSRATLDFKNKEFKNAANTYKTIMTLAEKYNCLDFDNIMRAGDSNIKCGHINKAQRIYESSKSYANTLHRQCRRHKKIADLLVLKNQYWQAVTQYLAALKCIPSDRGSKTRLQTTLKKLNLQKHTESFLNLNSLALDLEQLEVSIKLLKKELQAG